MIRKLISPALILLAIGLVFADTTTTRFGLTKPDVGSTNWGPKLNTNSDTIDNAGGLTLSNSWTNTNTFTGPLTVSTISVNGTTTLTGLASVSSITATGICTFTTISASSVTTTNVSASTATFNTVDAKILLKGKGVTDGSVAASGYIGESTYTATARGNFPTSGNWGDLQTVTLSSGSYIIWAQCESEFVANTITRIEFALTTTSGNSSTGILTGFNHADSPLPTANIDGSAAIVPIAINISASTTYYLKYKSTYSGSAPLGDGTIFYLRTR